jgi:hypothetical protein
MRVVLVERRVERWLRSAGILSAWKRSRNPRSQSVVKQPLVSLMGKLGTVLLWLCLLVCGSVSSAVADPNDWVEEGKQSARTNREPARKESGWVDEAPSPARTRVRAGEGEDSFGAGRLTPDGHLSGGVQRFGVQLPSLARPRLLDPAYMRAEAESFLRGALVNVPTPPSTFRAWLSRTHPEFDGRANPAAVLEVRGTWDDASQVLEALGIKHTRVKARELPGMSLDKVRCLVVDCAGRVPKESYEQIRDFVLQGGCLISTDWTVHNLVEQAFPGYIEWNGQYLDGSVVDAEVRNTDPELLAGLAVRRTTWKVDDRSFMVRVLRPGVVRVLARSLKLASMDSGAGALADPGASGALAVEFNFGRGTVLHLVGHFDYNAPMSFSSYVLPDPAPGALIGLRQVIATNFLVRALANKVPRGAATIP